MSLPVSIDSLKSTINRRGGIARGNRYAVYVAHPSKGMNSLLKFDASSLVSNLISGQGVNIGDFIADPRDMFLLCQSCSLPGKRITTTEATHNHNRTKKPYSMMTEEVTMSFLLTNDYYVKKYFDQWQNMIIDDSGDHYKTYYKRDYTSDVTIQQLSAGNDFIPGYSIKLENAYPIQISSVDLGNGNDGLMEVTVTWEYDNWRTVSMMEGFSDLASSLIGSVKSTIGYITDNISNFK